VSSGDEMAGYRAVVILFEMEIDRVPPPRGPFLNNRSMPLPNSSLFVGTFVITSKREVSTPAEAWLCVAAGWQLGRRLAGGRLLRFCLLCALASTPPFPIITSVTSIDHITRIIPLNCHKQCCLSFWP
jgi:hypothetical protein